MQSILPPTSVAGPGEFREVSCGASGRAAGWYPAARRDGKVPSVHFATHVTGCGWIASAGRAPASFRPLPARRLIAFTVMSCSQVI